MGFGGTLKHSTGLRYFNRIPRLTREKLRFHSAYIWRDHGYVWLSVDDGQNEFSLRMNRVTGRLEPVRGIDDSKFRHYVDDARRQSEIGGEHEEE